MTASSERIKPFTLHPLLIVMAGLFLMLSFPSSAEAADYWCYCPFLDGEQDRNGISCGGRFFLEGFDLVESESQCADKCFARLGSTKTVAASDIYLVPENNDTLYRLACDYDRISDAACSTDFRSTYSSYTGGELVCKEQFCYCSYPENYKTDSCAGKTTLIAGPGQTLISTKVANESVCGNICASVNLDYHGIFPTKDGSCDFNDVRDQCAGPSNPKSPTCTAIQKADDDRRTAITTAQLSLRQGSVIGLSLPLSDISIPGVIGRIINQILGVVGALGLAAFVYGGILYMTSSGNTTRAETGRKTLVWAVLGLFMIFAAYAVVGFVIKALT